MIDFGDNFLWTDDPNAFHWVKEKIREPLMLKDPIALCYRAPAGHAVAVYDKYNPAFESVNISFAGEGRWATRGNFRAFISAPFMMLPVETLRCFVHKKNRKSRRLVEHIFGEPDGKIRNAWGSTRGDAMIYSLTRPEWEEGKFKW